MILNYEHWEEPFCRPDYFVPNIFLQCGTFTKVKDLNILPSLFPDLRDGTRQTGDLWLNQSLCIKHENRGGSKDTSDWPEAWQHKDNTKASPLRAAWIVTAAHFLWSYVCVVFCCPTTELLRLDPNDYLWSGSPRAGVYTLSVCRTGSGQTSCSF